MNASSELIEEADLVRQSIADDVKLASQALAEFVVRYARTAAHKNAALAIKASVSGINDPTVQEALRGRMTKVLDDVLKEVARQKGDDSRLQAERNLFTKFRQSPLQKSTICRIAGLKRQYRSKEFVMGPLTFDFRAGEITALFSDNAHGKTTLMRTLIGELRESAGRIEYPALFGGDRICWTELRQRIGYLPQKLPDWRGSLADTLYFHAALRGLSPDEADTQIKYVVARLEIGQFMRNRWSELAGGTQLSFALAKVLVGRPQMLVLDEPLANLSPNKRADFLWDIRRLARSVHNPMTVLISSQVVDPLEAISDNVIFLHKGRVEFAGPREAIGAQRKYNWYGCDTSLSLSKLQEIIGVHVLEIREKGPSFIIKMPLEVSYHDMLQLLQNENVAFTSLRNIGQSVLGLFEGMWRTE